MLDPSFPRGARNYWKSDFCEELSDAAIDMMVDCFMKIPSPIGMIVVEHFHGAATRTKPAKTAFALRGRGFNLLTLSQWSAPDADAAALAAAYGPNVQRQQSIKAKYDPENAFHLKANIPPKR